MCIYIRRLVSRREDCRDRYTDNPRVFRARLQPHIDTARALSRSRSYPIHAFINIHVYITKHQKDSTTTAKPAKQNIKASEARKNAKKEKKKKEKAEQDVVMPPSLDVRSFPTLLLLLLLPCFSASPHTCLCQVRVPFACASFIVIA